MRFRKNSSDQSKASPPPRLAFGPDASADASQRFGQAHYVYATHGSSASNVSTRS
jgi:hypothetical protein